VGQASRQPLKAWCPRGNRGESGKQREFLAKPGPPTPSGALTITPFCKALRVCAQSRSDETPTASASGKNFQQEDTTMKSTKSHPPAKAIDAYLAEVPAEARATLRKLRKMIHAAAPKATEKISYRIPVFYHCGMLVGFAAFKNHCSFFPMSLSVIAAHKDELGGYDTSKGTIRFPVDKPLPATLVKKMVKARIKENEAGRWAISILTLPRRRGSSFAFHHVPANEREKTLCALWRTLSLVS